MPNGTYAAAGGSGGMPEPEVTQASSDTAHRIEHHRREERTSHPPDHHRLSSPCSSSFSRSGSAPG